mgnify:CR=1 FL=1|jgi:hypothetical protein
MVESIYKHYELSDDWRKTGTCTLVGDDQVHSCKDTVIEDTAVAFTVRAGLLL